MTLRLNKTIKYLALCSSLIKTDGMETEYSTLIIITFVIFHVMISMCLCVGLSAKAPALIPGRL